MSTVPEIGKKLVELCRQGKNLDAIEQLFPAALEGGELLVIDGGVLGNVPPSTLVDCTAPLPRLVREGAIPREELRRRAGRMAP